MPDTETDSRIRWTRALVIAASAAHILAYLVAAPEHVVDPAWPAHARFHVAQALITLVVFNSTLMLLVLRMFPRGGRSAWWALALGGAGLHGAYFLSFLVGGAPPELSSHLILGVIALVYAVGLAVGWRALERTH